MDYDDTPAVNDWLDTMAELGEAFTFGAVSYQPSEGWRPGGFYVLSVDRAGKVTPAARPVDRKTARRILQMTAGMVTEERWNEAKSRWEPKVDTTRGVRPKRVGLSPRTRFDILTRDGFRCRYCGANAPDTVLHVDHVVSRKDGGTDDRANLVTACQDCNLGKGARSTPSPAVETRK